MLEHIYVVPQRIAKPQSLKLGDSAAIQPTPKEPEPVRSGRGITGGGALSARIDFPNRRFGQLPIPTQGDRSSDSDVSASRLMQLVMNDSDKEWYAELQRMQSDEFLRPRRSPAQMLSKSLVGQRTSFGEGADGLSVLREFIEYVIEGRRKRRTVDEDDDQGQGKPKKNEVNVAGNVAGYTLPLGTKPKGRRRRDPAYVTGRAFGGAKPVRAKKTHG